MQSQSSDQTMKGILILIVATFFFAIQDGITKHLTQSLSVLEIVAIRFFFFTLFALTFAARRVGLRTAFRSKRPGLQILRSLLIASEIAVFASAVRYLGIAEIHALFACFPLLITALSVPMLGESVGWRRWIAVGIGFLGTLLIIRPGIGVFDPYALVALTAALMFAVYNILTRKVSRTDSFETSLVYFGTVGLVTFGVMALFVWEHPGSAQWGWLVALSCTAIIGHFSLIKALELVPAVVLQPFNYFVLVWAIVFGYFIFGEILDTMTLVGAAIVVASGVYIARREYKLSHTNHETD